MSPVVICVDGNIGAGKSTVLDELETRGYVVEREGLDKWGSLLKKFYTDPCRWSFTLQIAILMDMAKQYKRLMRRTEPVVFVERTPISALVFVQNSFNSKHLSPEEYRVYADVHLDMKWHPSHLIFLEASPELCFQRVQQRQRDGEEKITLEYLQALHKLYGTPTGSISFDARESPKMLVDHVVAFVETLN